MTPLSVACRGTGQFHPLANYAPITPYRQGDAKALGMFSRSGCSNVHGRPAKPDAEDAMKMCTVDESSPAGYLGHIERAAGGAR